jgi:hypothetical protein
MQAGSGTLWRIRRTKSSAGVGAPQPRTVPLYAFLYYVPVALVLGGLVALVAWLLRRGA